MISLIVILIPLLLVSLFYFSFRLFRNKKKSIKYFSLIPLSLFIFMSFNIFKAIFPFEEFYRKEWTRETDLKFPKTAGFKYKTATFPDKHNSYTATVILELSIFEFKKLKKTISKELIIPIEDCELFNQFLPFGYSDSNIEVCYKFLIHHNFKVQFLKDGKTIIFQRHN